MKWSHFFSILIVLSGCASKKEVNVSLDEAPKFDKKLNSATLDRNERVGVKDGTVKIQRVVYLEENLSKLQTEIDDLENQVYGPSKTFPGGIYLDLKTCRTNAADVRIGGNGVPEPMEKWQKISQKNEDFNYHVDANNSVIAVSEEDLATRISSLQKLQRMLNDNYDNFKEKLDNCKSKYKTALLQHGLNPDDMEAKGEWVEGPNGYKVWKMRRPATSDPEELMRRKSQLERDGN